MRRTWKDAAHLIRPALVFVAGLVLFLLLRQAVVPASFGQYGHYRGAALNEIRSAQARFAGQTVCASCHLEEAEAKARGKHQTVHCEACHGAAASHAGDPVTHKPAKLEIGKLCVRCHESDAAKPTWFKQVQSREHSGEASCEACHQPHSPQM